MIKAHKDCVQSKKSTLCYTPEFLEASLEPAGYYPTIEVWKCGGGGGGGGGGQAERVK
jgi:hypothetical protein